MYFTATGNHEAATSRAEMLNQIAPDEPDTIMVFNYLAKERLDAGIKRMEELDRTKIKVKSLPEDDIPQTNKAPEFFHDEIMLLYKHGLYIGKENFDKILALPRETLIHDLEKVLQDCTSRFEYFKKLVKQDGWNEENMSFAIHAMYLLGELRAEKSLDFILNIFRQGEKFLEFWFDDFITDNIWELLYYIARNQTDKLKAFILEPNRYTYARTEAANTLCQIVYHYPERKNEVVNWFKDVFSFFINSKIEENVIDSDAIGLLMCDVVHLQASSLIPEIEKLYDLGYVAADICGDFQSVLKDIGTPPKYSLKEVLMNIIDRYDYITSTWSGYTEEEENIDTDYEEYDNDFQIAKALLNERKIGRNEPCPCGSGKKYKKCCLNKSN